METVRNCIEHLQDTVATVTNAMPEGSDITDAQTGAVAMLLAALIKVQLIQLAAALKEGETNLENSRKIIAEIESPIKLFGRKS